MLPIGAAMLLAAQAATPPPAAAPDPEYYVCTVEKQGPESGGITYWLSVPVDGSPAHHRVIWVVLRQPGGLSLQVEWNSPAPLPGGRMDDRSWYIAGFYLDHRVRGEARIEVRRRADTHYPSEFAFAAPYQRGSQGGRTVSHFFTSQGRWGDLRAWLAGHGHVTFALVNREGAVLARQRLDTALLDAGAAAIEQARAEAETMARDYRNRCQVPEPIVVT